MHTGSACQRARGEAACTISGACLPAASNPWQSLQPPPSPFPRAEEDQAIACCDRHPSTLLQAGRAGSSGDKGFAHDTAPCTWGENHPQSTFLSCCSWSFPPLQTLPAPEVQPCGCAMLYSSMAALGKCLDWSANAGPGACLAARPHQDTAACSLSRPDAAEVAARLQALLHFMPGDLDAQAAEMGSAVLEDSLWAQLAVDYAMWQPAAG